MDVAELMKMIQKRQGDESNERYAYNLNLTGSTLFRYYEGERRPNLDAIRKMAQYYQKIGDNEMLEALADYALFGGKGSSS